jgi:hypothetical protein
MSDIDTTTGAVEAFIQSAMKEAVLSEGMPRTKEDTADAYKAVDMLRALAAERDKLAGQLAEAVGCLRTITLETYADNIGDRWATNGANIARATLSRITGETP